MFDSGAATAAEIGPLPARLIPAATALSSAPTSHGYDEQIVYKDTHGEAVFAMPARVRNSADESQRLTNSTPEDGALDRLGTPTVQELEYALRYAEFRIKK